MLLRARDEWQPAGTNNTEGGTGLQPDNDSNEGLRKRTLLEALAWASLLGFLWTADTFAKITFRNSTGIGKDNFRLINDQVTSAIGVFIMILFVLYWLRLFPLRRDKWAAAAIGHTFGSMVFAFGHHVLMIIQRIIVYSVRDMTYQWQGGFVSNLIVEYQKDLKIYLGIVVVVSAYQYYRRQDVPKLSAEPIDRLLVQTGGGETMLRYEQIVYLESSRNYVAVHTSEKEYLVRDTMANLEQRLAAGSFVRCHRSYLVNLDHVAEIRNMDNNYRITLTSGADIPLSRSYRDSFRSKITTT